MVAKIHSLIITSLLMMSCIGVPAFAAQTGGVQEVQVNLFNVSAAPLYITIDRDIEPVDEDNKMIHETTLGVSRAIHPMRGNAAGRIFRFPPKESATIEVTDWLVSVFSDEDDHLWGRAGIPASFVKRIHSLRFDTSGVTVVDSDGNVLERLSLD